MELIKLKDKSNGAVIEVKKSIASDFIGTGKYEVFTAKKEVKEDIKPILKEEVKPEPTKSERKIKFGKNI